MKKINVIGFVMLLVLSQIVFLYFYFYSGRTVSINCTSTFTRNSVDDYQFFFKGKFLVNLKDNGKGELTIRAWTEGLNAKQVIRMYAFNYHVEHNGQLYVSDVKETRGASDNVEETFYRQHFFDLNFDAGGQISLHRINNSWIFLSPDLMISICTPLE